MRQREELKNAAKESENYEKVSIHGEITTQGGKLNQTNKLMPPPVSNKKVGRQPTKKNELEKLATPTKNADVAQKDAESDSGLRRSERHSTAKPIFAVQRDIAKEEE